MSKIRDWVPSLKLRTRLIILNGVFLLSFFIFGIVVDLLLKSNQTMSIVSSEDSYFVRNYSIGMEYYLRYNISGIDEELDRSLERFNKAFDIAYYFSVTDSLVRTMPEEEWKQLLYEAFKDGVNNDPSQLELMAKKISFFHTINSEKIHEIQRTAREVSDHVNLVIENIEEYKLNSTEEKRIEIEALFDSMTRFTEPFSQAVHSLTDYVNRLLLILIAFLVVFLAAIVTAISVAISKSIRKPINILAEDFKRMAKGDLKSSIIIDYDNEFGILSKAFYDIREGLYNITLHAKKIASGDYTARLNPASDSDDLTHSLNLMAKKLEEVSNETERENWLQKGLGGLDDQMRGNYDVRELSDRIIVYLCTFLKAEMGAFYVFDETIDRLELTGAVGVKNSEVAKTIEIGDGLVGSAAKNNECQIIDVKDNTHKMYSATSEVLPEQLYLMPIHFGGNVQAVIELAAVHRFTELKLEFLELIKDRLSININAAVARFRNKELLEKSLKQAEVLEARDEELSQKLKENQLVREDLSRETTLLNSMMKTLPDFVYFKDLESRFLRVSDSLAHLFNVSSPKDLIGKNDFDFFPRKEAKKYFDEEQLLIKKGEGIIEEVRSTIDEDGEEIWTSTIKLPLCDENGQCIGTYGISTDVTSIKKLEIELNLQNEKLKQNQEELKATNEELHAQEEELRVANEELAEHTKILVENEKNLQVQQEELRVVNEELEAKTKILEDQKEEILENNAEINKARIDLEKKAKELELASQYKSEFLANMSHELRTPLNSMLILSKILGDNKNKNLTEDQLKSISIIHNGGKDLLELINEILDLSKIEAGKMNFDFVDVISDEIIEEIKVNFTPVAQNKNLSLDVIKSSNFPEKIHSDRQRLMQVIKNLLSNAFKFTSKGGITVKLGVPEKDVNFVNTKLNRNNTCFISVEDTGVGIPKSKVEAIFEAFQQADGSISRKFGGTGLGLSISKQIVQVFGGEIHVTSKEGEGAVFTVYLPLDKNLINSGNQEPSSKNVDKKEENKKEERETPDIVEEKEETVTEVIPALDDTSHDSELDTIGVLIIHSEGKEAEMLIDLCRERNFNAVAAASISEGIKLAEKNPPQAIIISAELDDSKELSKLKDSKVTARVPLHIVSRIEDFMFEEIQELQTPESKNLQVETTNIEKKIGKEFRQVLVVEDDPVTRIVIHKLFEDKNIIMHEAETAGEAYDMISTQPFDCIILDLGLPDFSGAELLDKLKRNKIPIPYVIINTAKELSNKELRGLQQYSESIVIKGIKSDERLMDEVSLFLHQVSNTLPQKAQVPKMDAAGFKGKKVLIVDDDIRNVFAMAQILEEREIEILEAENGEVAIDALKKNSDIDLVLMDVMMPVMNGYDAMKIIRKTPGIENIPIIVLTAKAMKEDYQRAIDFGANDFISKPVDIDKLVSLLKIWLYK